MDSDHAGGCPNDKRPYEDSNPGVDRRRKFDHRQNLELEQEANRRKEWEYERVRSPSGRAEDSRLTNKAEIKQNKSRPIEPSTAPPSPSNNGSSQAEVLEVDAPNDKGKITCFNYTKAGHYHSGCMLPPHCSLCEINGHTKDMYPVTTKEPKIKWSGYCY